MARKSALLFLFLVLFQEVCGSLDGHAAEKTDASLHMAAWRVPPGFVSQADPSDKTGNRKPLEGIEMLDGPRACQYDLKEFFKAQGITFPEGSDAIYDQSAGVLAVRNTLENLDLVDVMMGGCELGIYSNVVVEITTAEYILPEGKGGAPRAWPTFHELTKIPAENVEVLSHISVNTKSGRKVLMRQVRNSASVTSASTPSGGDEEEGSDSRFRDGGSGTIVEVEPIVGPDGTTVDASVRYQFRFPQQDKELSEITFLTEFSTWESYPVVIFVSQSPRDKDRSFVVTANVRVVNYGGWAFDGLEAADTETRKAVVEPKE